MSASTTKTYTRFVGGVITEAGPLTFPENALIDGLNIVLNRDGSIQRRLGMDYEQDFVLQEVNTSLTSAYAGYRWSGAGGSTANQIIVVQAGQQLLMFDGNTASTSANLLDTRDLSSYIDGDKRLQFDSGNGLLFVATGQSDGLIIEYNPGTVSFTITELEMKIRDFFGLDDGLAVNEQPASLSTAHNYNLLNQGWPAGKITAYKAHTGSVYPSNAQQWFLGRKDDNTFDPGQLKELEFGTSPAPKGHYIISPFTRSASRNAASGLTTPSDEEASRPSTVAFAFQRAWWAGMESETPLDTATSPNMTGMLFYSRVIRNKKDLEQYHSDADPTSEVDSELTEADGGYIIIPDSGKIHRIVAKDRSVIVLAQNGVWEIVGGDNGFTATTNQPVKVTSFGVVGPGAVIDAESALLYWNRGGIYLLAAGENGAVQAVNLSQDRVQTWFNTLSEAAKENAVGAFDSVNRRVMWMYNDQDDYDGVSRPNRYNREVVLDLVLQAFTFNSVSSYGDPSPYIAGYVDMPKFLQRQAGVRTRGESVTKYLVVQDVASEDPIVGLTFGWYRDVALRDWRSSDAMGTAYESYAITGWELLDDVMRNKQAPFVVVHSKRTEREVVDNGTQLVLDNPGGLLMQARWGWSDSSASNKWQTPQQVYRYLRPYVLASAGPFDPGFDVVTTRNKVRGTGKALSIKFYSDGDKDFHLLGWAINYSGNENV
jgi:hypothetical protein